MLETVVLIFFIVIYIVLLCCYALNNIVLEIVALIFVDLCCIVLFCLYVVFLSDKFHVRLLYDRIMDRRNDICMYVCINMPIRYLCQ